MIGISDFSRGYLRRRASFLLTDSCVVFHPTEAKVVYDEVTKTATTTNGSTTYTGSCRVWEVPAGSVSMWEEQRVVITTMYLTLPYDAPVPEPDDEVKITGSNDPSLVGKYLTILSLVRGGGLRGSRVMRVQFTDSSKVIW